MSLTSFVRYSNGQACRRPMPANLRPEDFQTFEGSAFYPGADALARPVNTLAFRAKGEFFDGLDLCPEYYPANDTARRLRQDQVLARASKTRAEAAKHPGDWLWITDRFSANYYHWICDCLPRLEAWVASGNDPRRLLLPGGVSGRKFVRESLCAYPEVEVGAPADESRDGLAERAWIAGPVAANGNHHPGWQDAVANRMRSCFQAGRATGARLWVSRSAAARRRIANEAALAPILEKHGFRIVAMEQLAFAEQVRLAASASILAGPHGAGLANMAFMRPGGTVLELRQVAGTMNSFHSLAAARRQKYFYLPCQPAERGHPVHAADLVCEPEALDRALSRVAETVDG